MILQYIPNYLKYKNILLFQGNQHPGTILAKMNSTDSERKNYHALILIEVILKSVFGEKEEL